MDGIEWMDGTTDPLRRKQSTYQWRHSDLESCFDITQIMAIIIHIRYIKPVGFVLEDIGGFMSRN